MRSDSWDVGAVLGGIFGAIAGVVGLTMLATKWAFPVLVSLGCVPWVAFVLVAVAWAFCILWAVFGGIFIFSLLGGVLACIPEELKAHKQLKRRRKLMKEAKAEREKNMKRYGYGRY